ncbi:MAG: preprotein translocase subunit SecG [Candidatus Pacebacteria bacterium]|nr:preprotein translocase subunit SecG [Candidatus Paceibacterota bacterium]
MEFIANILPTLQLVISILLIITVLLQQTGVGQGTGLGGGDASGVTPSRRGLEKVLLKVTIILASLFFLTSVLDLIIK